MLASGVAEALYPRVLRLKRTVPLRGLSAKTGEYLALKVYEGRSWARVMLAAMLRRTSQTGTAP